MKMLKYNLRTVIVERYDKFGNPFEKEILTPVSVLANEAGWALAEKEASGEIEEYDDGREEVAAAPSQLDIIEAQVTYTAMMTDTLLEG